MIKHRKRIVAAIAAVAAATLVLSGCSPSDGSAGTDTEKTLTMGVASENTWGFVRTDLSTQVHLSAAYWMPLYDTLVKVTPDLEILPNLATEWKFNDDRTEITFTIRDDVKFTDGTPLDAQAVVDNILTFRDGEGGEVTQAASSIADAVAPDSTTVVVTLKQADPGVLPAMAATLGAVALPADIKDQDKSTIPVGSGPYILDMDNTTEGSIYTYVRNKDYWDPDSYPFDTIVLKPMTDVAARMNALKAGEIDGAAVPAANGADIEASGFTLNTGIANWAGLHILDRDGKVVPALANVKVRQAMNMVFDRAAIVKNLFQGYGVVNHQAFRESSNVYVPSEKDVYPFDVDAAKKLMADAGYADGFDMKFPAISGSHDAIMPIIKQQLGAIGIRIEVESFPIGDYFNEVFAQKYGALMVTLPSFDDWRDIKGMVTPTALWNIFKTEDPELDGYIETARTTGGDEQKAAYQNIGQFLIDNAWYGPWATPNVLYGTDDAITATLSPGQVEPLIWDIKPAK